MCLIRILGLKVISVALTQNDSNLNQFSSLSFKSPFDGDKILMKIIDDVNRKLPDYCQNRNGDAG